MTDKKRDGGKVIVVAPSWRCNCKYCDCGLDVSRLSDVCQICQEACRQDDPKHDPVNHPSHYTDGKIEVIDFIEDKKLGYHLGNAVKYICRAGKKDPMKFVEDLKKARWYLDRHIAQLESIK